MITIGIPFYNAERYLEAAIKSVFNQSFNDWELILVDDGSTDGSLEIAKRYESDRVRVISDGINKKLPARLNQIIDLSKYDFIARMDADDIILSNKLQDQLNFLVCMPNIDLVSTGVISIDKDNNVLGVRATPSSYNPSLLDVVSGRSGIIHASILARKSWFMRNRYNEKNIQAEDFQLWLDAKLKNDLRVGFIEEYLYCYREDQNIKLAKMLRSYAQQRACLGGLIVSHKDNFITCLKEVFKLYFKSIAAFILFMFKKENYLLRKRFHYDESCNQYRDMLLKAIR